MSTGQGILGNNMFCYCLNTPTDHLDSNGYWGIPNGLKDPNAMEYKSGSLLGWIPPGVIEVEPEKNSDFALIQEKSEVSGGTKVATIMGGKFDWFSTDNLAFNLLSFELTVISLDLEYNPLILSLFNLGNISLSAGIKSLVPYGSVMASLWSPTITSTVGKYDVTLALHFGAVGYDLVPFQEEGKIGFANGIGFTLSWS